MCGWSCQNLLNPKIKLCHLQLCTEPGPFWELTLHTEPGSSWGILPPGNGWWNSETHRHALLIILLFPTTSQLLKTTISKANFRLRRNFVWKDPEKNILQKLVFVPDNNISSLTLILKKTLNWDINGMPWFNPRQHVTIVTASFNMKIRCSFLIPELNILYIFFTRLKSNNAGIR